MMIKTVLRICMAVVLIMAATGCSIDKSDDPAEFAQTWLNAAVDPSSDQKCTVTVNWLTELAKKGLGRTCEEVTAEVHDTLGVTADTEFTDCAVTASDRGPDANWKQIECSEDAYAEVLVSGEPPDLMVERVYPAVQ